MIKKIFDYYGGILFKNNATASSQPIDEGFIPSNVVLPLIDDSGVAAKPLVSKGENVFLGQKVAEAGSKKSVPIHASISGRVIDVAPWLHPVTGQPQESIIIESDGKDEKLISQKIYSDYYSYSHNELIEAIKESGITWPELPHSHAEIDTIIINACANEHLISSDDSLIKEHSKEIIEGTKLLMYILNAVNAVIAIEENKKESISILKKIVYNEPNIDVVVLKTKYPNGSEKHLIKAIKNLELPVKEISGKYKVIVQGIHACFAINRAIKEGESYFSRIITVNGSALKSPVNIKVRIGTLVSEVAKYLGLTANDIGQFVLGGSFTGISQYTLDVPVLKSSAGVLFFSKNTEISDEYYSCFRCGKCVTSCPMKLYPNMLSNLIEKEDFKNIKKFYPGECIGCGICTYVCPAKRPIKSQIEWLKKHYA